MTSETCPNCGHPLPASRRPGKPRGFIAVGSLPDLVITWLRENVDEELTADDISVKFTGGEAEPTDVRSRLLRAVECGYIDSFINERGRRIYCAPITLRSKFKPYE